MAVLLSCDGLPHGPLQPQEDAPQHTTQSECVPSAPEVAQLSQRCTKHVSLSPADPDPWMPAAELRVVWRADVGKRAYVTT